MSTLTHKFTLPSGFECEVKPMIGKHQRILTQKGGDAADKLNEVLVDILARVGDVTAIDGEFVSNMLSADRKAALVMSRHFTLDFPETFKFTYTFRGEYDLKDGEGETQHYTECKEEQVIPTPDFPITPYKGREAWIGGSYKDIPRERTLTLKKSGMEVTFKLLDGKAEARAVLNDKNTSSHTPLMIRGLSRKHVGGGGETVPILLDARALDNMILPDLEQIRAAVKEEEGEVDTVVILEHPHADKVEAKYTNVQVDLLQEIAFFFPSQAI